jgi:hypothetical protein
MRYKVIITKERNSKSIGNAERGEVGEVIDILSDVSMTSDDFI